VDRPSYPNKETKMLSHYTQVFNTAEIDSTFYAYPSRGMVYGWLRYTLRDFVFSAKLPRVITRNKKLDVKQGLKAGLNRFAELIEPLHRGRKLFALLIQLPPGLKQDLDLLEGFFKVLLAEKVKATNGYFNNHYHGYAVENCLQVLEMLGLSMPHHGKVQENLEGYFSNSTCFLALGTDFVSFANRRCCEDIFELVQLLLIVTALFTGNGILFTRPKGDGNAFASFAVDEEITSMRALLSFARGGNTLLIDLYSFIYLVALDLNYGNTCKHSISLLFIYCNLARQLLLRFFQD